MRLKISALLLCAPAFALACGGGGAARNEQSPVAAATPAAAPSAAAATAPPKTATCQLISAEEFREVQGEEPADAQGTEHLAAGLSMSQCFYRLPTFSKSVNLEVARAAEGAPAGALKDYWRKL